MADDFDNWLGELDIEWLLEVAEAWGSKMYTLGKLHGIEELKQLQKETFEAYSKLNYNKQ